MEDVSKTILSQYANSPVITSVINQWNVALDLSANKELFLTDYWNVDTASGVGLDIWGRIVGVSRYLYIPDDVKYFGFFGNTGASPFNVAPFYPGDQATKTFRLDDDIFRLLIMAKAYYNICTCSVYDINFVLQMLFSQYGSIYCMETGNMSVQIILDFDLTPWQLALIIQAGVIPVAAGVSVNVVDTSGLIINDLVIVV